MEYSFKEPAQNTPPEPLPARLTDFFPMQDNYLVGRNLDHRIARYNQWYPTELKGPRIVIPCTKGFWQARAMGKEEPRYLSSKGSRNGAFCIVWPRQAWTGIVIVEGPMDALAAASLGYYSMASLGAGFGKYVIDWVCRGTPTPNIIIIPDLDNEEFGFDVLTGFTNKGYQAEVRHPIKKDLASMTVKQREKLLAI